MTAETPTAPDAPAPEGREGHGGDHALDAARAHGVETMFTLSGAHVFPLYDAAVKADQPMRLIDVRHEPSAVFAAARQSQFVARTLRPYVKDSKTDVDPLAPPVAYPGGENGEGTNGFAENLRYLAGLASEVRVDRESGDQHNRWIVLGPKPRGDKKRVSADVRLPKTHPRSAQERKRNGEPLWLIDETENSNIKRHAQAKAIADKRRDASLREQVSYSFDTLPLPNVEEYDLVRVLDRAVGAAQVRVTQATIPLGLGGQSQSWGYLKRVTYHKKRRKKAA